MVSRESTSGPALLIGLPIAAYGAAKIIRFSNSKLEKVLADYAAGKPLSRSLKRKLKPRFFVQSVKNAVPRGAG